MDESEVFAGLIMFYNDGDARDGYREIFLSIPPKNQPLLLALVFHEYADVSDKCKPFMDRLKEFSKSFDTTNLLQACYAIVKRDPIAGYEAIQNILNKNKTPDDKQAVGELRSIEREYNAKRNEYASNNVLKYDFDFSSKEKFSKQYKAFFGGNKLRDYEYIKESFVKDLEILENFLVHASIPAIRIERPFVAREVQAINELLIKISTDLPYLTDFIKSNYTLLLHSSAEKIRMATDNLVANKEAMAEVTKVLNTLND